MEMKKINSGKLRAIGYDARARMLQVQLDDGSTLQYSGVGEDSLAPAQQLGRGLELLSRQHRGGVHGEARFRQRPCRQEPARRIIRQTLNGNNFEHFKVC